MIALVLFFGCSLYGLDNFYYRRSYEVLNVRVAVYTDLIISTIVDESTEPRPTLDVYTDLIISTIVDKR